MPQPHTAPLGPARMFCPLPGAETGDGRDESNRSMQERLADAANAQTAAEAEGKVRTAAAARARRRWLSQRWECAPAGQLLLLPGLYALESRWISPRAPSPPAAAQAADVRLKLLAKQAEQQRKALATKGKDASRLQAELAAAQKKVDACNAKLQVGGPDALGWVGKSRSSLASPRPPAK
jgi:hypothetical protein